MQQQNPGTDAILKAMQEREKEQLQLLSLSNSLVNISSIADLSAIVQQRLKPVAGFDNFIVAVTDEHEKQYSIFYHDNDKTLSELNHALHEVTDGYFNTALNSAEPVTFDLLNSNNKRNNVPFFIQKAQQAGIREVIAIPLHYHKHNPTILFLFFKKPQSLNRTLIRLLKGLSFQLAITVSNILVTLKIEKHLKTLQHSGALSNTAPIQIQQHEVSCGLDSMDEKNSGNFSGIIGKSQEIQKVITLINQVAASDSGVLLLGESGTGKEVIAHAIHMNSAQKNKTMIKVNCAAIPVNLIESELFGHEKGSFTGATERRIGKFELAHNSTLFLDEIGELPLEMQTKLLRVLQEKEFEPIGSKNTIKVNVRIIAATNRDLQQEVTEGKFRSDLFYRLNIFPILIPPLRNRKEDIPLLSAHFINEYCSKTQKKTITLSAKVNEAMMLYSWPGNVRELKHSIERSILLATGPTIKKMHFPENNGNNSIQNTEEHHIKSLEQVEREHILKVIKLCNGRISGPNGAALKLGMPSTTLISKMQKLGIQKGHLVVNRE